MNLIELFNFFFISFLLIEYDQFNYPFVLKIPYIKHKTLYQGILISHIFTQNTLFYIIYGSSLLEIIFLYLNQIVRYMNFIHLFDKYVVGFLMNYTITSGLLIAKNKYGRYRPTFIKKTIHCLLILSIIYFLFDKTTQIYFTSEYQDKVFFTTIIRIPINILSIYQFYKIQYVMKKK